MNPVQFYEFGKNRFDIDALAFLAATGITDAAQKNAVNKLVKDLKNAGIWTKFKAIYPVIGGTATTHKYNLKDPRDLDAAFRLSFNGTITHSSNGIIQVSSIGAYTGTFFKNANFTNINSAHISVYRTNDAAGGWTFGNHSSSSTSEFRLNSSSSVSYQANGVLQGPFTVTVSGFYMVNRSSSTQIKLFNNNTKVSDVADNIVAIGVDNNYSFGTQWTNGQGNNGQADYRFMSMGQSLSDSEASAFYTIIQTYQTTLGRQL